MLLMHTAAASAQGVQEDEPRAVEPPTLDLVLAEIIDPLDELEQQIGVSEYEVAAGELTRRVRNIESSSHQFDERLIRPLTLLGDAMTGLGRHDEALEHYQRAVHLTRVNQGLTAPEQIQLVYREANAFKALGDYESANGREEYAYHVLTRTYDPQDEALLPGLYHLAGWYERTGNVFAARMLFERAVSILEAHDKDATLDAIPALQGLALTHRLERFPRRYDQSLEQSATTASMASPATGRQAITVNNFPAGESALQKVIQIRQTEQADDPVVLAEGVLDLADWYTLFGINRRAEPLYGHAWELLESAGTVDVASYFASPLLLYYPAPSAPNPPPPEQRGEPITGFVEVAFDVTNHGQVRSLSTVASEPDGLMDFRVRKSLRMAVYRPMLIDGVPVGTAGHTYRHEFPYFGPRAANEDELALRGDD